MSSSSSAVAATNGNNPAATSDAQNPQQPLKPALSQHPRDFLAEKGTGTSKSDRHIAWDEPTIEKHDGERGTRMKIDEPKTPYTEYKDDASDAGSVSADGTPHNIAKHWDDLSTKLHTISTRQQDGTDGDERISPEEMEEKKKKHDEFVKHRHDHYNEFEMLKKFREQHPDDDDDDEGEGEGEGEGEDDDGDQKMEKAG